MCVVERAEYDLLYIIDLDGSFRPNLSITPTVSSLVASDNQMHLTFLDPSKYVANTVGCYSYCDDTCFRSMRYYVDGPEQELYKLKVCSRSDHSRCSLFKGGRRGDTGSHEFTAHLPAGQLYDAVFLDGLGKEITPTRVRETVEKTFCTNGVFEIKLFGALSDIISPIIRPVSPPVRAPIPIRPPAPIPIQTPHVDISTPVRPPDSVPVPVTMPIRQPVPVPVKSPIRSPVPVPLKAPVRSPVKAPVRKGFFSRIFSRIRRI